MTLVAVVPSEEQWAEFRLYNDQLERWWEAIPTAYRTVPNDARITRSSYATVTVPTTVVKVEWRTEGPTLYVELHCIGPAPYLMRWECGDKHGRGMTADFLLLLLQIKTERGE